MCFDFALYWPKDALNCGLDGLLGSGSQARAKDRGCRLGRVQTMCGSTAGSAPNEMSTSKRQGAHAGLQLRHALLEGAPARTQYWSEMGSAGSSTRIAERPPTTHRSWRSFGNRVEKADDIRDETIEGADLANGRFPTAVVEARSWPRAKPFRGVPARHKACAAALSGIGSPASASRESPPPPFGHRV